MQISIDDRDHEIRQLSVVRSQSEGKDEAMKIAARQNREILRILQEAVWKSNFGRPTQPNSLVDFHTGRRPI